MDCGNYDDTECALYKVGKINKRIKIKFKNDQVEMLNSYYHNKFLNNNILVSFEWKS